MAAECDVQSEIEVLQSIYLDELLVSRKEDRGWEVSLVLYPSTAEDSVSQFVRLTLTLTLDQQYPLTSPIISIHNPRGLSDDKLSSVQKCLQLEAQSCLGSPVLYQLIEKAKEILTESNIPYGNCVICLYDFKEGEIFTKTGCYHYFHSHCLGRYVSHSERELRRLEKELEEDKTRGKEDQQELTVVCPVCREPLAYNVDELLSSPAPQMPELDEAAIGTDFQNKWLKLQKLLERQRSRGGIIDPEVESNRFLIHINEGPCPPENGSPDVDVSPGPPSASGATCFGEDNFVTGTSHCRGAQGQRHQGPARGSRRGGKSRPQPGRAAPVSVHLDKLSLAPDASEEPPTVHSHAQRTGSDAFAQQNEDLETERSRGATSSHCGRRRGPNHSGTQGFAHHHHHHHYHHHHNHWAGRGSRGRGSGPRQGHGQGFRQRMAERERGREEVL